MSNHVRPEPTAAVNKNKSWSAGEPGNDVPVVHTCVPGMPKFKFAAAELPAFATVGVAPGDNLLTELTAIVAAFPADPVDPVAPVGSPREKAIAPVDVL